MVQDYESRRNNTQYNHTETNQTNSLNKTYKHIQIEESKRYINK